MNRRQVLLTLGGGVAVGVAGCSGGGTEETETAATPPLGGIYFWSNIAADAGPVDVDLTVEKNGSQVFETTYEFDGEETRKLYDTNWLGEAVPYTVTLASDAHDEPTTVSSTDFDLQGLDDDCWTLFVMFDSSQFSPGAWLTCTPESRPTTVDD